MWREYARDTQRCVFFLYGRTPECRKSRGSLPELRILPVYERLIFLLFRWWKVRSLFWTGRRIHRERWKHSMR
jgi:hypothetical protein